ncbi:MAG: transglutaminase domain-containing protein [Spirochaetaceae bacterium]|nr:transglutaminase domain-containing protein [Myxococcales bacterium]MCB9722542.1 transglutaminase domain-containing protein [Spirochaetaceae bacterium]
MSMGPSGPAGVVSAALPVPESDDLGRYLEDTITIDWQTPSVSELAGRLVAGIEDPEERVRRLFAFVRDEVDHALDVETEVLTCRASEVLRERVGLCYAKSHLLAAMLRYAGFPTGFCYVRLASDAAPDRFVLHAFNAVYWKPVDDWIFLDARGGRAGAAIGCRFRGPFELLAWPDADRGEAFLPTIHRRPARRIVDLLERAPDLASVRRHLPDSI